MHRLGQRTGYDTSKAFNHDKKSTNFVYYQWPSKKIGFQREVVVGIIIAVSTSKTRGPGADAIKILSINLRYANCLSILIAYFYISF